MDFNPTAPTVMHIDINSCFATIEQQANPLLRGLPIAVVAYDSPRGCILAASVEAKRYGVKTGMHLFEGRDLCPNLLAILPDPDKYRFIHKSLNKLLGRYCGEVYPKSIDEFVLDFQSHRVESLPAQAGSMGSVAQAIKQKIKKNIGEWITVSIGIATNRQLAKVAAGMVKPDGLVEINKDNFRQVYKLLKLTDLHGINIRNELRLNSVGVTTVLEFYKSPPWKLKAAFKSVNALYWYSRLRGFEIDSVEFARKSFGNSYSIPQNLKGAAELSAILAKLVNKTASRLRKHGYAAYGIHVGISFKKGLAPSGAIGEVGWHHGERLAQPVFYTSDIFTQALRILKKAPATRPVHTLAVSCYDLVHTPLLQLSIFEDLEKKRFLAETIDRVNNKFGSFVLMTGNMLSAGDAVKDRIAFGN